MKRCLELAQKGAGNVAPNPMVGAVVVCDERIIGEGYHEVYGGPHAEVNAINSVKDQSLLSRSTIYVNLEPCFHYGKTPPCADLLVEKRLKRVVIGAIDDNELVGGKGVQKLKDNDIEVTLNVLKEECLELNKRFYTFHQKHRPFVILKWAITQDGFMARSPNSDENGWISGELAKRYVHQIRAENAAILVGKNTALKDNPKLTTRYNLGQSPFRIVIDQKGGLPSSLSVFQDDNYILVTQNETSLNHLIIQDWPNWEKELFQWMVEKGLNALIVEGGKQILNHFIQKNCFDEAHVIQSTQAIWKEGIKGPEMTLNLSEKVEFSDDTVLIYRP